MEKEDVLIIMSSFIFIFSALIVDILLNKRAIHLRSPLASLAFDHLHANQMIIIYLKIR